MKTTLAKIVLAGAVLASTLSAASAATRHQMRASETAYGVGSLTNAADNQFVDNEQARRDLENAGG